MNLNFRDWRRTLKVWALPLIGIPAMLVIGYWFEGARFILFAHHLFWFIGIMLLINPVVETFWPSAAQEKKGRPAPQPSAKAQQRREARKLMAKQNPTPASAPETPAERLARLQKQKEAVDQKIEKLTAHEKKRVK